MKKRTSDWSSIGDLYGSMLNKVETVKESTVKKGGNDLNDGVSLTNGGPSEKGGWQKEISDYYPDYRSEEDEEDIPEVPKRHKNAVQTLKQKIDDPNTSDKEREKLKKVLKDKEKQMQAEEGEETVNENRKIKQPKINRDMSKSFEQLCSDILNENWGYEDAEDLDALGLDDATPDSSMEDDFGGEDEDTVSFTLDKATAQKLHDVLMDVLGGDEEGEIESDELDFEGEEEDMEEKKDEMDYEEDEESVANKSKGSAPSYEKLQGRDNKVGKKPRPGSNKASSEVTDKVGNDGTVTKEPDMGKQNKVGKLKQGQDLFQ